MYARLQKAFTTIENTPLTLGSWAFTLFAIITVRIAIEFFFEDFQFQFFDVYFYKFSHYYLTFTFTYLVALPVVTWFAKTSIKQAAVLLLFGFLAIWTPPVIDQIMSLGAGLWSYYDFDSVTGLWHRYLTFFGDRPEVGITYGVRVEVALVVCLFALYLWVKNYRFFRIVFGALALYTVLFLVGALPSLVTFLVLWPTQGLFHIGELDVARVILTPQPLFIFTPPDITVVMGVKMGLVYATLIPLLVSGILYFHFRTLFLALLRNLRFPQVFYHLGLFAVGAGLVLLFEHKISFAYDWLHFLGLCILSLSLVLAWLTSVIVNDLNDVRIDTLTNPDRPLIRHTIDRTTYVTIGIITFGSSVFLADFISTQFALLIAMYQTIAWVYSTPPLRLKRFPFVATILAAGASMLILFGGYIIFSVNKNIAALSWPIPTLLFVAYTFLLPIKDFKDIAGDRADGVLTLPILWGEQKAKRLIGAALFLVFTFSVFVLNIRPLAPLALFFGALAYWVLQLSSPKHRYFSYHRLSGWYIAIVAGYVFFLTIHFYSEKGF